MGALPAGGSRVVGIYLTNGTSSLAAAADAVTGRRMVVSSLALFGPVGAAFA